MTYKIALPLIFALGTSTAAFAQHTTDTDQTTSTGTADYGTGGVPLDWDEQTAEAFFVDPGTEILLTETEITNNWAGLSDEKQQTVLSHCMEVNLANEGAAMDGTEAPAADAGADPMASAEGLGASAPMIQLCGMLDGM